MTIDTDLDDLSGEFSYTTRGVLGHDYIEYELAGLLAQLHRFENRLRAFAKVVADRATEQDIAFKQIVDLLSTKQKEKADADGKD